MARDYQWQGMTEQQVKQLDISQFMKLIPSRQRRSLQRGFSDEQKILLLKLERGDKNIKTHCRNMIVLPIFMGHTIKVHTGKDFVPIIIQPEMLGHRLGEFAHSRKMVSHSSAGVGATRSSKAISAR